MASCFLSLGGNIGDVAQTFRLVFSELDLHTNIQVVSRSRIHQTIAVGEHAGPPFLNAAAHVDTSLDPESLLDLLQSIEAAHGRKREIHWRPRTLDLDLLLYGDDVISNDRLTVPHPALWYRRFVLDPLVEIAEDILHPQQQMSISELRNQLLQRPLPVTLLGDESRTDEIAVSLNASFPDIHVTTGTPPDTRSAIIFRWSSDKADGEMIRQLHPFRTIDLMDVDNPKPFAHTVVRAALGV